MIDAPAPESSTAEPARRWMWWIAGAVTAIVLAGAGVAVAVWPSGGATRATAAAVTPAVTVDAVVLPRPAASAAGSDWQEWVAQESAAVMKRQTTALLAGDLAGFMADAAPSGRADLGRRFRSLRALHVTRFDQRVNGNPWAPKTAGGVWRVVTSVDHCFVERDCVTDIAVFDTLWRVTPGGLRFTGFHTHDRASACYQCPPRTEILTRPWETTELSAQVGRRTLVAVPLAYRSRLADLSRRAEAAAAVADRYTVGPGTVDRYRVFVADPASWKLWYQGFPGSWVAGQAVGTASDRIETELLLDDLTPTFTDKILRHELAHVATLRTNMFYGLDDVWWLVEGMGDHVEYDGDRAGEAWERRNLHRYLRAHKLPSVGVPPPARNASLDDASSRYAVGYFALHHLIAKYGRPAALTFFKLAVQQGVGLETASRNALGKPWAQVDRECAAAIRKA